VLELGAGTGGNLSLYPSSVTRLMREMLRRKLSGRPEVEVLEATAESLPVPVRSFDTVVATLVLCSVKDPAQVVAEIHRVLRPGGTFLFLEHIGAPAGTWTRRVQGALEPVWKRLAGNCHLTRHPGPLLEAAGFRMSPCTEELLPGSGTLTGRSIRGVAHAPPAGAPPGSS
jgi:SAM-dependent methyltransferase